MRASLQSSSFARFILLGSGFIMAVLGGSWLGGSNQWSVNSQIVPLWTTTLTLGVGLLLWGFFGRRRYGPLVTLLTALCAAPVPWLVAQVASEPAVRSSTHPMEAVLLVNVYLWISALAQIVLSLFWRRDADPRDQAGIAPRGVPPSSREARTLVIIGLALLFGGLADIFVRRDGPLIAVLAGVAALILLASAYFGKPRSARLVFMGVGATLAAIGARGVISHHGVFWDASGAIWIATLTAGLAFVVWVRRARRNYGLTVSILTAPLASIFGLVAMSVWLATERASAPTLSALWACAALHVALSFAWERDPHRVATSTETAAGENIRRETPSAR
jgi:hypothetical protein